VLSALVLGAGDAAAQATVSGVAGVSYAEHRVDVGFGVERTAGPVITAGVTLEPSRSLALALYARAGVLRAQTGGAFDRDVGELALGGRIGVARWLGAETTVAVRSYASPLGRQRWLLLGAGAEARLPLARLRATGLLRLGYLPLVVGPDAGNAGLAFWTAAGMEYRAGRARLHLLYKLERCDFSPPGAARRLEQLSGLTVDLMLPLAAAR
jgi:hypothetical protein